MSDTNKNLEALNLALKTEQEGYQLYKSGAEQSQNEFVKSIFRQLFKDELMHMDLIKRFYAELTNSGSWTHLSQQEKNYKGIKGELKTIFTQTLKNVQSGKETIADSDLKVYQKAIDFEKKGVKMYTELHNAVDDTQAQKLYAFLRDMEQEHADVLDKTYQYLKDPNSYYLQEEGWTLDY